MSIALGDYINTEGAGKVFTIIIICWKKVIMISLHLQYVEMRSVTERLKIVFPAQVRERLTV